MLRPSSHSEQEIVMPLCFSHRLFYLLFFLNSISETHSFEEGDDKESKKNTRLAEEDKNTWNA